jgi:hypothetical protein
MRGVHWRRVDNLIFRMQTDGFAPLRLAIHDTGSNGEVPKPKA